jgi:redox-sensitive bicupin YhaK (pirin superfamily)
MDQLIEVVPSREGTVGGMPIRRALPRTGRRTVGAWCFADHMGPITVARDTGIDVAPHPHCGLQTVTWLVAGEVLHRDSLGTEQTIAPGQLNLMTAGHGVAHSEERTGRYAGPMHGIQLWIAQPEATRHGAAAFEHHATLPQAELGGATATVLVGEFAGVASPARHDTELVGVELVARSGVSVPLRADHEYGIVVLEGAVAVGPTTVEPGNLGFLGSGRDELTVVPASPQVRLMLLGGASLGEPILMSWNFVGRTRAELEAAHASWNDDDGRFGTVASSLPRIPAPPPVWRT